MENIYPVGMLMQKFPEALFQDHYFFRFKLTIYRMERLLIVNFLLTIHLHFQWLTTWNQAQLPYTMTLISNQAFQLKIIFNPDLTKQAQEVIFSRETMKLLHFSLSFNNILLENSAFQTHLGLTLDAKLNFVEHIKNITQKISRTMDLLRRFRPIVPASPYWLYVKHLSEAIRQF